MKASDIRDMAEPEITRRLDEFRQEMFNLRFQIATRKLKNHQRVKLVRRDVARLLTVLREREIESIYAAEIAELQGLSNQLSQ